jgi:hypothetical protein
MELFNEFCILLACYHGLLFTDMVPDVQTQYIIGWSLIGVTAFNIVVNVGMMIMESGRLLIRALKIMFRKCKLMLTKKVKKGIKYQVTETV